MKIVAAALLIAVLGAAPARGSSSSSASFTFGEWNVHTNAIDANNNSGDFSVPGHLTLTRPTGDIAADRANGNWKHKHATLYGHVVLHDNRGGSGFADFGTSNEGAQGPATLTTDQLDIDSATKLYTATGNVHYVSGSRTIDSQKGVLDDRTKNLTLYTVHFVQGTQTVDATQGVLNDQSHVLDLTGNVRIVDGDRKMNADHVVYNTASGDLHAKGNVTMAFPGGVAPPPSGPAAAAKKKKRLIPFGPP